MNNSEILNILLKDTDIGDVTVKQYLFKLLTTLWQQGEGFSGKRPFGKSCWEFDIYKGLIREGLIEGYIDEDGMLEECDSRAGRRIINELLSWMQEQPYGDS